MSPRVTLLSSSTVISGLRETTFCYVASEGGLRRGSPWMTCTAALYLTTPPLLGDSAMAHRLARVIDVLVCSRTSPSSVFAVTTRADTPAWADLFRRCFNSRKIPGRGNQPVSPRRPGGPEQRSTAVRWDPETVALLGDVEPVSRIAAPGGVGPGRPPPRPKARRSAPGTGRRLLLVFRGKRPDLHRKDIEGGRATPGGLLHPVPPPRGAAEHPEGVTDRPLGHRPKQLAGSPRREPSGTGPHDSSPQRTSPRSRVLPGSASPRRGTTAATRR